MATQTSLHNYKTLAAQLRLNHLNGAILMLSGSQPASVNGALTGTLIGVVSLNGAPRAAGNAANGISWDAAPLIIGDNVRLVKPIAENWQFTCLAAGTIGWCRYVGNPVDNGLADPDGLLARLDATVSTASGSGQVVASRITFNAADVGVAIGQITSFNYTLSNALQPVSPL